MRNGSLPTITHCPLQQRLHLRSLAARRDRLLNAQSVLYSVINLHGRLPTSSFTRNCYCPPRLDFHPYTQLVRATVDQQRFDPPPNFHRVNWPGIHRWASGPPPLTQASTPRPSPYGCGRVGFPTAAEHLLLNLANEQDSLGIFRNARLDAAHIIATPNQPVPNWFHGLFTSPKDSFQLSLTLLVNYRSRAGFRIGSFCLHIHARFPTHATLCRLRGHMRYGYGAFTSLARHSRRPHLHSLRQKNDTHISLTFELGFGCPVPFSFATTHGISLISIPPPY